MSNHFDDGQRREVNSDAAKVERLVSELGEHFDAVQVFASRNDEGAVGGTSFIAAGCGNWFTRYGQIQEWMLIQDERVRESVRAENSQSESEDDEDDE